MFVSLVMLPGISFAGGALTGEQILAAFQGKTVHWEHTKRSDTGMNYYDESGKLEGIKNGSKREGHWKVVWDELCFDTGSKNICRTVASDGDKGFYLIKNGTKKVIHITKIDEGNTLQ